MDLGKRAEFNVNFSNEKVSYAIALGNGVVAITGQPNQGPTITLSKDEWSRPNNNSIFLTKQTATQES